MKDKKIKKEHGLGGKKTRRLIEEVILPAVSNKYADRMDDSASLPFNAKKMLFTTDGYVVSPVFFPGGDIGKLAVSGTVNDILAQGGEPLYISIALIIEEGFKVEDIRKIALSAGSEAKKARVDIVCGDIKVVEKGGCDGIFAVSTGVGRSLINFSEFDEGDHIIVTGNVGEHGSAIFEARNRLLSDSSSVKSDCESLSSLVKVLKKNEESIKFLRDPTRGGLAQVCMEIAAISKYRVVLEEKKLPVSNWVEGLCYIAGLDYLYLACEGRMVLVVSGKDAQNVTGELKEAGFINSSDFAVLQKGSPQAVIKTKSGGSRVLDSSEVAQVPRIC